MDPQLDCFVSNLRSSNVSVDPSLAIAGASAWFCPRTANVVQRLVNTAVFDVTNCLTMFNDIFWLLFQYFFLFVLFKSI